jgi:hypothetical protein
MEILAGKLFISSLMIEVLTFATASIIVESVRNATNFIFPALAFMKDVNYNAKGLIPMASGGTWNNRTSWFLSGNPSDDYLRNL